MKFRDRRLRRFYERGQSRGLPAEYIPRIDRILANLAVARGPRDLSSPSFRLHPLTGDRQGYWSVRVSGNWRITFRFEDSEVVDIDLVDYH